MSKKANQESVQKINKIIKMHDDSLVVMEESFEKKKLNIEKCIVQSEEIITELGIDILKIEKGTSMASNEINKPLVMSDWECIISKAEKKYPNLVYIEDMFTEEELKTNHDYIAILRRQFGDINKIDKWDYTTAGIVGTLAALIDFLLVTKVNVIDSSVTSGTLKSGVEKLWDDILPKEKVALLEKKYKVPFDISTNTSKISQEVLGLNPKTHRFQSLGHDPILGFIFGVKDLLKGELTAIDGNGRLVIQRVSGAEGKGLIESIVTEFGHLISDVNATSNTGMKLSIPAPFTPLLQMIQVGSIKYKNKIYTVGDLSKRMYNDGYNFNHFLGMSIPVVLIHVLMRLYAVLREMFSEEYKCEKHKSDILLFVANSVLCAENVGKLVVTKNPFAINYVSWLDTTKYAIRSFKHVLVEYQIEQNEYIQKHIDEEYIDMYATVESTWDKYCRDREVVYL